MEVEAWAEVESTTTLPYSVQTSTWPSAKSRLL